MNSTIRSLMLLGSSLRSPLMSLRTEKSLNLANSKFSQFSSPIIFRSGNPAAININNVRFHNIMDTAIKVSRDNYTIIENSYRDKSDQLKLQNTAFIHCSTSKTMHDGGAIYAELCPVEIFNCLFVDCYAKSSGGAIRAERSTNTTISNCIFADNSADYLGGACCFSVIFELKLSNSNFTNNYGKVFGATVAFMNCDAPNVIECVDNNAISPKGAWYMNNGESEFGLCSFIYMKTNTIYGTRFAIAGIYTCNFQKLQDSAILWNSAFSITVTESVFDQKYENALKNLITTAEKPIFNDCHFDMTLQIDFQKLIPKIPIPIPPKKKIKIGQTLIKKKYAQTLVIIQNDPANDPFSNNEEHSLGYFAYFITCAAIIASTIAINHHLSGKLQSKKGILDQLNNYTPGTTSETPVDLNNKDLFPQIQNP